MQTSQQSENSIGFSLAAENVWICWMAAINHLNTIRFLLLLLYPSWKHAVQRMSLWSPRSQASILDSQIWAWNRPDASISFSPFIVSVKSGCGISASHSTNIFLNRNLMTRGHLCLILVLALLKIVVRPQTWHDNIWSQRRQIGVTELCVLRVCIQWCNTNAEILSYRMLCRQQ